MDAVRRPVVTAGIALVGAGLVVTTSTAPPEPAAVQARAVNLTSGAASDTADPTTVALLVGGSGQPQISAPLVANINNVYIQPNFPGAVSQPLGTPQQLYPITGVHNGFFDPSVQSDVAIIDDAVKQQLAAGNHVVLYGQSQGATADTIEMENLMASAHPPAGDQVGFVFTGDPDLPNGGMLERFSYPGLPSGLAPGGLPGNVTIPTLGTTFFGATPADTPYPTVMYTGEYDGFADFPRYPINFLADLNAMFGIVFVHGPMEGLPASVVDTAFKWPTSPGYDGHTTYYLIPTENLPLLDLLRGNPLGNAVADLLQPDLKVLINLGYGPDNLPYSQYPDVDTPASGLFPNANPLTVLTNLATGAQQGVQDFLADLKGMSASSVITTVTGSGATVSPPDLDPGDVVTQLQTVVTENSNALATLVAAPLDVFMPVVDDGSAIAITLPTAAANLVLAGIGQLASGNVTGAFTDFTDPIGGSVGLFTIAGFEIFSAVEEAVDRISSAVHGAVTADMDLLTGLL